MRILIAEDDSTTRGLLIAALKKHGHEIVATETGAAAWQALQQLSGGGGEMVDGVTERWCWGVDNLARRLLSRFVFRGTGHYCIFAVDLRALIRRSHSS